MQVYTARVVVHMDDLVSLFGDGPYGVRVPITEENTVAVVAVPIDQVEALTREGVIRL